jgi:hypothetical protein
MDGACEDELGSEYCRVVEGRRMGCGDPLRGCVGEGRERYGGAVGEDGTT